MSDVEAWKLYFIYEYYWDEINNLILSVPEISNNIEINVYPNPVSNYLSLSTFNETFSPISYQIYNSIGNLMSEGIITGQDQQINVSNFYSGVYFLKLKVNNTDIIKKIIKL